MNEKIGHYSGNRRQDVSSLEEPDEDTEDVRKRWLESGKELLIKRRIRLWRKAVEHTTDFNNLIIHMVGQSHIDIAWMWRFAQTRKKAQVTFRKAIEHSKMFPETFCFALSEPLLLEWINEDNPDLFKDIQETVKAGGIELVGGSYVEPDCMMPSGESFIRQRLYGMRFFRDHFGILPEVEWFLDSFGYNYGLPQILVKSGAKYFWTSKITWNRNTIFPFVNFWWQGPDGSKILTANFHMGNGPIESWRNYGVGHHLLKKDGTRLWNYTMDYGEYKNHVEDEICPHVGCFFGKGDGGHGPTHKEVAYANEYQKTNLFKWSRVEKFYKVLEKYSDKFPIWNDELYLETHRGCFSNHSQGKRHNRKYENDIVALESFALVTSLINSNYKYPMDTLEQLWKTTLKNQFHDVLPGSSIPEVYDDCWDDWMEQDVIIDKIKLNIGSALSNKEREMSKDTTELILFNSLSWKRKSRLFIPIDILTDVPKLDATGKPDYAKLEIFDGENKVYTCQPIAPESEDLIEPIPAGWWTVVELKPLCCVKACLTIQNEPNSNSKSLEATNESLSNDLISLKVDKHTGAILKLRSNGINDEQNMLNGKSSNLTYGFLDKGGVDIHAWNIFPEYWKHPKDLPNNKDVQIELSENGPIFTTLEIRRNLGKSPVIQKITLFKECPEVFLEYIADWKQKDIMTKILYSTATGAEIVTADMAYCALESKTNPETPCDKARYEKICHKYFDLSTPDKEWGIAILNEGKYAFDVNGGDMRLTLIRCCKFPIPAPEAWVNEERKMNNQKYQHKVPSHSELGPFKCRYALLPHKGGALTNSEGDPNTIVKRKAEEFNNPILIIPTTNFIGNPLLDKPLIEIEAPNVYLGSLKQKEWDNTNSIIIRFIEFSGLSSDVKVKFNNELAKMIADIKAVDLLERETNYTFKWNKEDNELVFKIRNFEICTFEISLG